MTQNLIKEVEYILALRIRQTDVNDSEKQVNKKELALSDSLALLFRQTDVFGRQRSE